MTDRLVVTGGSGSVAGLLRPFLSPRRWQVVLLDTHESAEPLAEHEEFHHVSVLDTAALADQLVGARLVVHLAAHRSERDWAQIVDLNMTGTRSVLEAARTAGLDRLLLASSLHAVGCSPAEDVRSVREPLPRPDTFYGLSKVVVEGLGRLYADRFGMTVVAARLGTVEAQPSSARSLSLWLAPADLARLVEAVAVLPEAGAHVVWAVSANTHGWVDLSAGHDIGFHPAEDAQAFAAELGDPEPLPPDTLLAGGFVGPGRPLGGSW